MERVVEPELLDHLPPSDPRAIHSRRDLRRINFWMGNFRFIKNRLLALTQPPSTLLEFGSGDGALIFYLARHLAPVWQKEVKVTMLDMAPAVSHETLNAIRNYGWNVEVQQADIRAWAQSVDSLLLDAMIANLFLHHFTNPELKTFFQAFAARTSLFIASEPRRWKVSLLSLNLLWLIGCNQVTRNDADISVRAGFRGKELSELWPSGGEFDLFEAECSYATHLFVAKERAGLFPVPPEQSLGNKPNPI